MSISRRDVLIGSMAVGALGVITRTARAAGDVVLMVMDRDGAQATFTLSALEALTQHDITTSTPWSEAPRTYRGPRLSSVLDAAGVSEGERLTLRALNDYMAHVPLSEAREEAVILATRRDGERLSIREKGPLFVIYPFDQAAHLRNELHYARSVWQLNRITVE